MAAASAATRYAALQLLLSWRAVVAQIYPFETTEIPKQKELLVLYAFYIYSEQDAPDKSLGKPSVEFNGLACHSTAGGHLTDTSLGSYQGVQLILLRERDFLQMIDPKKFCASRDDVARKRALVKDQLLLRNPSRDVYMHTVRFPTASNPTRNDTRIVEKTGFYILLFSNCGDFSEATVKGSVVVKHAYGFLPGNEYYKMPFYGWLMLGYVGLAVIWMGLSIRWWKELFNIQNCIAVVIMMGAIEAFMWYVFYSNWNSEGFRGKTLFIFATLLTVVKATFSYMLVLVAALGWGVTRPFLDRPVVLKIQVLCFVYIVLRFIQETVMSFRHILSLAFVLLCALPVALLNGGIFYWVFTQLSTLVEELKEGGQTEKLMLFQRLWKLLVCSLAAASSTLLFQIFNITKRVSDRWKYQWIISDAISHILFLLVLAAMMYLWAPNERSRRYAYSTQVDDCEDPKVLAVHEDGKQDDADKATGGGTGVAPADVIGAPGPDQDGTF